MNVQINASVTLINEKIKFIGTAQENNPISIDYLKPWGDEEGYMPLELLLISLASCSGSTIALVLRKNGKTVKGLKVDAEGIRREKHPTSFSSIKLHFKVISSDISDDDLVSVIKSSEERLCPVWDMLKGRVEITYDYQITES